MKYKAPASGMAALILLGLGCDTEPQAALAGKADHTTLYRADTEFNALAWHGGVPPEGEKQNAVVVSLPATDEEPLGGHAVYGQKESNGQTEFKQTEEHKGLELLHGRPDGRFDIVRNKEEGIVVSYVSSFRVLTLPDGVEADQVVAATSSPHGGLILLTYDPRTGGETQTIFFEAQPHKTEAEPVWSQISLTREDKNLDCLDVTTDIDENDGRFSHIPGWPLGVFLAAKSDIDEPEPDDYIVAFRRESEEYGVEGFSIAIKEPTEHVSPWHVTCESSNLLNNDHTIASVVHNSLEASLFRFSPRTKELEEVDIRTGDPVTKVTIDDDIPDFTAVLEHSDNDDMDIGTLHKPGSTEFKPYAIVVRQTGDSWAREAWIAWGNAVFGVTYDNQGKAQNIGHYIASGEAPDIRRLHWSASENKDGRLVPDTLYGVAYHPDSKGTFRYGVHAFKDELAASGQSFFELGYTLGAGEFRR